MHSENGPIGRLTFLATWGVYLPDVALWAHNFTHYSIDIPPYMARNYTPNPSNITNISNDEL